MLYFMSLFNNYFYMLLPFFFFQAEDGIRDAQESRGLGDVYKRQLGDKAQSEWAKEQAYQQWPRPAQQHRRQSSRSIHMQRRATSLTPLRMRARATTSGSEGQSHTCLLYTSDAADEEDSGNIGGGRIVKKKKDERMVCRRRRGPARIAQ
eukprot:TRINITY_DN61004_c0_g1_i1.p1 TRINITY_DN61004_c0_g1~~TRINITY_DN61004_c0_g1_i1.p1  ORF type:complete len:150 (-),score=19.19 TRINITY_DN61004_c0_g1_i1:67-516(-)